MCIRDRPCTLHTNRIDCVSCRNRLSSSRGKADSQPYSSRCFTPLFRPRTVSESRLPTFLIDHFSIRPDPAFGPPAYRKGFRASCQTKLEWPTTRQLPKVLAFQPAVLHSMDAAQLQSSVLTTHYTEEQHLSLSLLGRLTTISRDQPSSVSIPEVCPRRLPRGLRERGAHQIIADEEHEQQKQSVLPLDISHAHPI